MKLEVNHAQKNGTLTNVKVDASIKSLLLFVSPAIFDVKQALSDALASISNLFNN